MAIRLNQEAVDHAQNLIKSRQYERNSDWSEAQPSAEEEGEQAYRRKRLGSLCEVAPSVRHRGHRSALIAAKQRAGSEAYNEVQSVADKLLEELPGKNDQ
jgi:hypothetical protein